MYSWLFSHTKASVAAAAQVHKWGVTPLNAPVDVLDDEHFAARGVFVPVPHPVAGTVTQLTAPFRLHSGSSSSSTAPPDVGLRAPLFGEHDAALRARIAEGPGNGSSASPDASADSGQPAHLEPPAFRSTAFGSWISQWCGRVLVARCTCQISAPR